MNLKIKCLYAKELCLKGVSRIKAIELIMNEFDISFNSARNIVYNYLWEYNWVKSDYPKNRKRRRKKDKIVFDDKFQISKKVNISNNDDFTF